MPIPKDAKRISHKRAARFASEPEGLRKKEGGRIRGRRIRFNRLTSEPLKIPQERFQKMVKWFAEQPNVPPELANALKAVGWLVQVDTFREAEEAFMIKGNYEDNLPDHRVFLAELIAEGERLVWNIKKNGMAANELKFTFEDVQATLDSLHTSFRCEHGPRNSQKTNELIAQLFDGPQS